MSTRTRFEKEAKGNSEMAYTGTAVLSNFQFLDPQCIVIHTGKDGGSACPLRDVLFQTNFPSKPRSTFIAYSHLRLIILMSLFPSRVCLPLAAGKVMSFVSTILAKKIFPTEHKMPLAVNIFILHIHKQSP